jgi:hypothetical protein
MASEDNIEMAEISGAPGFARVKFNKSPLDGMRFKNSGITLEEAMNAEGRRVTVCNAGILNEAW